MGDINSAGVTTSNFYTWYKPTTAKYIQIFACSGGAGGGGGGASAASTAGSGGSGGGGSPYTSFIVPAIIIPSVLYIQPGSGGTGGTGQVQGGAAATNGAVGTQSIVSIRPNSTTKNTLVISAGATTSFGKLASGASNGAASGTTASATLALMPLSTLGFVSFTGPGTTSGAGGTTSSGSSSSFTTNGNIVGSGGGGGAVNSANTTSTGGAVATGGLFLPTLSGGLSAGGRGKDGWNFMENKGDQDLPFMSTGGTGGGSNASTLTGGAGGNGGPGSGGGGGGGTNGTASVAGAGGNGGPGFVIISWF